MLKGTETENSKIGSLAYSLSLSLSAIFTKVHNLSTPTNSELNLPKKREIRESLGKTTEVTAICQGGDRC